jgi:hypothetical protein
VDCAYVIRSRKYGQQQVRSYVGQMEFETAPTLEIEDRLLEYYALLRRKHKQPIVQVLVCPFETSKLPRPPHQIKLEDGEVLLENRYRVVALWQREASELLASGRVELYSLLPAMKGATSPLLSEGLKAMKAFYAGDESRLCMHLLWFSTLLGRTTTVNEEDKGEAKGLQEALLFAVEFRFPTLLGLAQERAERVKQPEVLKFVLRGLKAAQSEEAARLLLETLAA